ncbi:hypothetical protein IF650_01725 [Cellulosimicrobium terreum]|nr:hypothetical protein [Cellulosimicrobium terreum]
MTKRDRRSARRKPDTSRFVQVRDSALGGSIGVEVSTGRAWVGVDRQVGHGSADALFALMDEQYVAELSSAWSIGSFTTECWSGQHEDLLLFHPGIRSRPERWLPSRTRMLPPGFMGEIWWHVDALGAAVDDEQVEISRSLAAGTASITTGPDGVSAMTFRLVGDGAYPRPDALIAGLTVGGDREQARSVLGDPVDAAPDVYAVEADRVRLGYDDDGLVEIVLERPVRSTPMPEGPIRAFFAVLGEPEHGAAFRAVARLAGDSCREWLGFGDRRLVTFDGGVEAQLTDARVLSARIRLVSDDGPAYRHGRDLLPGVAWPPSRAEVHGVFGAPAATSGRFDLHRYGTGDLVVEYGPDPDPGPDGETPSSMTTVPRGVSVSHTMYRWRSGEVALFVDALGRELSHPLVEHVRGLAGVRLVTRNGVVTAVEIGGRGHQTERLAAFVDGIPAEPTRKDVRLGVSHHLGDHDDLRDLDPGWMHIHSSDGTLVTTITVSQDPPPDAVVRRWG